MNDLVFVSEDDGINWEAQPIEEFYSGICSPESYRPSCWVYFKNRLLKWNDLQKDQRYNDLIAGTGAFGKVPLLEKAVLLLPRIYHFQPIAFVATRPSYIIEKVRKIIVKHRIKVALKDYKKSA